MTRNHEELWHGGERNPANCVVALPPMPRRNATLEMWRNYLHALYDLPVDTPNLAKALAEAHQTIREKEAIRRALSR